MTATGRCSFCSFGFNVKPWILEQLYYLSRCAQPILSQHFTCNIVDVGNLMQAHSFTTLSIEMSRQTSSCGQFVPSRSHLTSGMSGRDFVNVNLCELLFREVNPYIQVDVAKYYWELPWTPQYIVCGNHLLISSCTVIWVGWMENEWDCRLYFCL